MAEVVVNGRFRCQRLTGIQRVAEAITSRLTIAHEVIAPTPKTRGSGVAGHAWEQLVLPARARGRLIWGPCNTGPLALDHQIVTIHGAGVFDHPEWFSANFVRWNRTVWPVVSRRARAVVTVSNFSKQRIHEVLGVPNERIHVIYNGVDEQFRPACSDEIDAATRSVGVAGRPYFATLCTLEPRKNLKLVLAAWERARHALHRDTILLVVGGKGSNAVFNQYAGDASAASDSVVFSGYVSDDMLPALLSGASGVLYPSLYEGFGLPVLEAMACGAPAVTTRRTSLPEVGGDAALYVDAHDPEDLAATLVRLSQSEALRRERRELGLARAALFGWGEAAERMDQLLRRFA